MSTGEPLVEGLLQGVALTESVLTAVAHIVVHELSQDSHQVPVAEVHDAARPSPRSCDRRHLANGAERNARDTPQPKRNRTLRDRCFSQPDARARFETEKGRGEEQRWMVAYLG